VNVHLVELEKRALALKCAGNPGDAVVLLEKLLEEQPGWEHGYGAFNLAECYEEQGNLEKARVAYAEAVARNQIDPVLLGGYASFLFLHGELAEAFDTHLLLLSVEFKGKSNQGVSDTILALNKLGRGLGLSQEVIDARILQASLSGS
jgi:tetratricopeptide (TPR) repeat protein